MKRIFLTALLLTPLWALAHEPSEGLVHAAFGPFLFQGHSHSHYFKAPPRGGFGMVVEADVNRHGGLELTLIYMKQTFSMQKESKVVTEEGKRMYIGMGYRHWFTRRFSMAPAFYSSYLMGDAGVVRNDWTTPNPPTTSARDTVEYGFDLSFQQEFLRSKSFSILLDARYAYSVTPKPNEDANFYGMLVAFKYFIQGKQPDEDDEL